MTSDVEIGVLKALCQKMVEWSEEDQCYVGSIPGWIGKCCHGDNEEEVFHELGRILDEWIVDPSARLTLLTSGPNIGQGERIKKEMNASEKELFRWANQLPDALWEDVRRRPPKEAAEAVGAVREGNNFNIDLIGETFTVDPAAQRITNVSQSEDRVDYQTGVVLLTTLAHSKGVPPSGRMAVPQELPGGRMFFTGAHTVANAPIAEAFQEDSKRFIDRILEIGGERIEGADEAFRLPGLPQAPLYLLLWEGDSEAAARAVIGIDDRAHFHLDLSGVFALTNLLVWRLCRGQETG